MLKSATRVELWFALALIDDEKFELTPEDSIVIAPEDNQMNLSPGSIWETMLSWRSFCVEPLQRFWQMPEDIRPPTPPCEYRDDENKFALNDWVEEQFWEHILENANAPVKPVYIRNRRI